MPEGRVPVSDILKAAKGMMQKQLYSVFTSPVNGLEPG